MFISLAVGGLGEAWSIARARTVAARLVCDLPARWAHVRAVGELAEDLVRDGVIEPQLAAAAWLHDIGYAPDLAATGFHPPRRREVPQRAGSPDRGGRVVEGAIVRTLLLQMELAADAWARRIAEEADPQEYAQWRCQAATWTPAAQSRSTSGAGRGRQRPPVVCSQLLKELLVVYSPAKSRCRP